MREEPPTDPAVAVPTAGSDREPPPADEPSQAPGPGPGSGDEQVDDAAAAALARDCFGNLATFAAAMNTTAWELGAHDSHFVNPHGLPAYQYSTARDMARIAFRAYREPFLRRLVGSRYFVFVYATGRSKVLENTNKLLKRSSIFNGMKTGYTNAAGRCLISSASMGGREVILAQFGSKTQYIFDDAERMMRWGLAQNGLFRLAY